MIHGILSALSVFKTIVTSLTTPLQLPFHIQYYSNGRGPMLHQSPLFVALRAQKVDYDWARETWTLEKESALKGDLMLDLEASNCDTQRAEYGFNKEYALNQGALYTAQHIPQISRCLGSDPIARCRESCRGPDGKLGVGESEPHGLEKQDLF